MIAGIGIDTVEIERVEKAMENPRFVNHVFTPNEQRRITGASTAAGIFAAKEAVVKALGTGFSRGIKFTDVEVLRDEGCAPYAILYGVAAEIADGKRIMISISHDKGHAVAMAILEGRGDAL